MNRNVLPLTLAILALTVLSVAESNFTADEGITLEALLPKSGEVSGLRMGGTVRTFPGEEIFDFIDGAGEVFLDYNFVNVATADYYLDDPEKTIIVEAYEMKSSEDAFGIYRFYLPETVSILALGDEASVTPKSVNFRKGPYYVKVYTFEEGPDSQALLRPLAERICERIPEGGNPPTLLGFVPEKEVVERSERFLHCERSFDSLHRAYGENVFSLDGETNMILADIKLGKDEKGRFFIVEYPSEKAASSAEEILKQAAERGALDGEEVSYVRHGPYILGAFQRETSALKEILDRISEKITDAHPQGLPPPTRVEPEPPQDTC